MKEIPREHRIEQAARAVAFSSVLATASALIQCNGEALLVGSSSDAGTDATAGAISSSGGSGTTNDGAIEVWSGFLVNYRFPSGSDALTLRLTRDDASGVAGTAFFGDPPELAPPSNPDVGYPPNYTATRPLNPIAEGPWEKFRYTILGDKRSYARMTLKLATYEIYRKWCELETPYPVYDGGVQLGYDCLPTGGRFWGNGTCFLDKGDGTGHQVIDCGKDQICNFITCACDATRCSVDTSANGRGPFMQFDLDVEGDSADGNLDGLAPNQTIEVHLTRQ